MSNELVKAHDDYMKITRILNSISDNEFTFDNAVRKLNNNGIWTENEEYDNNSGEKYCLVTTENIITRLWENGEEVVCIDPNIFIGEDEYDIKELENIIGR